MNRLAGGAVALALGLGTNSLLGPLALGIIRYRYTPSYENQAIALDAVNLVAAAPLLLFGAWLALRGSRIAGLLIIGPALLTAYMMPQYILGADYVGLDGNNERFFILHIALFILGWMLACMAWSGTATITEPRRRPGFALLMLLVAAFLVLRYVPVLVSVWSGAPTAMYLDSPTAFWLIAFLDLGIVVPVAVCAAGGLLTAAPLAERAMRAVVAWFALVGFAVAAMGWTMLLRQDPLGSASEALVLSAFAALFIALAVWTAREAHMPGPVKGVRNEPTDHAS
ncbi:MAG: hypothetical protein FJ035_00060 [Chloroflexi bacterium]|nr:hypothetical protein [Chloroflexota bacterium]